MRDAFSLLKIIKLSEKDIAAGNYKESDAVFSNLRTSLSNEREVHDCVFSVCEDDLSEIIKYYAEKNSQYALKLLDTLEQSPRIEGITRTWKNSS